MPKSLKTRSGLFLTCTAICAAVVASIFYAGNSVVLSNGAVGAPQDVMSLERRTSLLEQRLYSIETSIRRLEQHSNLSQRATSPTAAARDPESLLLRSELDALRRRVGEIECGLVKLDERTLADHSIADKDRKKRGVSSTDTCRQNSATPLSLSARP